MSDFFEQYKRPEWQRRRLEVMSAARFQCEECGTAEETLNVHHVHYVKSRKVWEYEDWELVCLCEKCHKSRHDTLANIKPLLGSISTSELLQVWGYVVALGMISGKVEEGAEVNSFEEAAGIGDAFQVSPYDVISTLRGQDGERPEKGVRGRFLFESSVMAMKKSVTNVTRINGGSK